MIVIIGAGKFGKVMGKLLSAQKLDFVDVEKDGTYSMYSVEKIMSATRLLVCVPASALANCVNMISQIVPKSAPILNCTKGVFDDLITPSDVLRGKLKNPVASLMGPNLSAELEAGKPAIVVIAGDDAYGWAELFSSEQIRPIVEQNQQELEFAGAAKNIAALGVGLVHGYYGSDSFNTMGSFLVFCHKDIAHIFEHKSADDLTTKAYLSDMFATCMSEKSRNHAYGHACGLALKNNTAKPKPEGTIEGVHALKTLYHYAQKNKVPVPTICALYDILIGQGEMSLLLDTWI